MSNNFGARLGFTIPVIFFIYSRPMKFFCPHDKYDKIFSFLSTVLGFLLTGAVLSHEYNMYIYKCYIIYIYILYEKKSKS